MKYVVLLVVLVVAIGIWRSRQRAAEPPPPRRAPALPQDMLACTHCGVHIPQAEALMVGRDAYCCAEHRRLGPG